MRAHCAAIAAARATEPCARADVKFRVTVNVTGMCVNLNVSKSRSREAGADSEMHSVEMSGWHTCDRDSDTMDTSHQRVRAAPVSPGGRRPHVRQH